MQQESGYVFQSQPRPVHSRRKYRDPNASNASNGPRHPVNIMHDKRVVRGSTYAPQMPSAQQDAPPRRTASRRSRPTTQERPREPRSSTPEPVPGRAHMEVQTADYLEMLVDRLPDADAATQTDVTMDRPVSPLFVPKPSGPSRATQIEEGDLFDFDMEVEPILEVLVGKSLDQALMEVLEEEELRQLQLYRDSFEQKRNAAVVVVQRLEAAEIRREEEKQRRLEQERARKIQETKDAKRHAAETVAKETMNDLKRRIVSQLEQAGHFYDPVLRDVETNFMPWLVDNVAGQMQQAALAHEVAQELVDVAVRGLHQHVADELRLRAEREEARRQAEAEEAERLRIQQEKEAEDARLRAEAEAAEEDEGDED